MTTILPLRDRSDAGRRLGAALQKHAGRTEVLVRALPMT